MNFFSYILFGLSVGLVTLLTLRNSTLHVKIPLSKGLLCSLEMGLMQALLLIAGIWFSSLWQFSAGNIDTYVFLGIELLLVAKLLLATFSKNQQDGVYDISRAGTFFGLAVALGINDFIGGIGIGFLVSLADMWLKAGLVVFLLVAAFSYLGIMLGRQEVPVKQRRWMLFAALFILVMTFMPLTKL